MSSLWGNKLSALVTGGGSGIGRAICLELASRGCRVTVSDVNETAIADTVRQIKASGGTAIGVTCDVTNKAAQEALFRQHLQAFHSLDIVILNAGIAESDSFLDGSNWMKTVDVDLDAVLEGTRIAALSMIQLKARGRIVVVASAGGLFPMPYAPIYAAAKAGLVNFTRSIAPVLAKRGIALSALCPQPVDTPMGQQLRETVPHALGKATSLIPLDLVVKGAMMLLEDPDPQGRALLVHLNGNLYDWVPFQPSNLKLLQAAGPQSMTAPEEGAALKAWLRTSSPALNRKVQVFKLSVDFRSCTRIVSEQLPGQIPEGHLLIRRIWAGVNASDVNWTSGRYIGSAKEAEKLLPFGAGFESVGVVAAVGPGVQGFLEGDAVAETGYGAFSDFGVVEARKALPLPKPLPEAVALLVSGLTASIGLEQAGRMRSGETVLVTAAAGGTGQFAVQLAKAAGNRVVATCGGAKKADLLRQLGVDRVIDYHKEDVKSVLKSEFPNGVDIIYESVGGDMLKICLGALAKKGRLIVIGMMSQYSSGWQPSQLTGVPEMLLTKSASVTGFFLMDYMHLYRKHLAKLMSSFLKGRLHIALDPTPFRGLESVPDAVEYLQSGKSLGKVVVQIPPTVPSSGPADSKL